MERGPLPIHVAYHGFGVVTSVADGVATRSAFGPYVEALADAVERVTVVGYDPPVDPQGTEDLTEYVIRPKRRNVTVLSLGPKGGRRDYAQRARRVRGIVGPASTEWDVVIFRLVNRRANLVFGANRCPRVVSIIGGSALDLVSKIDLPLPERLMRLPFAIRSERHYRKILRSSGLTFTNGEELLGKYRAIVPDIALLRESALRADQTYRAVDRLDGPKARFLIAGQIRRDKGVFEALDAFGQIRSNLLPSAELHIAGIGASLPELQAEVRKRGLDDATTFHGWVPAGAELFGLVRQMDVLFCLSEVDFLPRVVYEAMANGVLVVATRTGSLPRVFEDGREIVFVTSASSDDVEDAVRKLVEGPDLRRRIIAGAFAVAQEAVLDNVVQELLAAVMDRWPELSRRGLHPAQSSR